MISAVLFDLDGTLYVQEPLRALMAAELGMAPFLQFRRGRAAATWRVLRTFRHVREELRDAAPSDSLLEDVQYNVTAERCRVGATDVRRLVETWMFIRPLRYLAAVRRPGARAALAALKARGVPVGVFSDYPTDAKLRALGLEEFVSLQLCATDTVINAFKPHPRGFLVACERWGLAPDRVAYVGDRPEVDAAGAAAAGMPCFIVGRARTRGAYPFTPLARLGELPDLLARGWAGPAAPAAVTRVRPS